MVAPFGVGELTGLSEDRERALSSSIVVTLYLYESHIQNTSCEHGCFLSSPNGLQGARARGVRGGIECLWLRIAPGIRRTFCTSFVILFLFSLFLFRYGRFGRIKLLTPTSLAVYRVGRDDKGMYQCSVTNKRSSAQAMAELKLGGKLLCSAVGSRYPIYA